VQIISAEIGAKNNVYQLAKSAETISYEILVKLDDGIRREVV